ncbi:MAG: twin-arginine translocase TatA/TatE family subunit [Flavobacteriaceae bacterium]|nr:MAG: twin-arginine translocase TatA/TatE family subunit [Flavobacteriaceae bacterium]
MNTLTIFLALPGPASLALIAGALILLFGGRKIPELMKGIGGGIKEFKKATQEEDEDKKEDIKKVDKE